MTLAKTDLNYHQELTWKMNSEMKKGLQFCVCAPLEIEGAMVSVCHPIVLLLTILLNLYSIIEIFVFINVTNRRFFGQN